MKPIRLYCICGAKVEASSEPRAAAELVADLFTKRHTRPGHGLTDAATARKARTRADRLALEGDPR